MNIHQAPGKSPLTQALCLLLCLIGLGLPNYQTARADDPTPPFYSKTFPYFPAFVNGKDCYSPLVQVRLDNNTTATFAIDTGSSHSYISDTAAKKLGIPFNLIPPEEHTDLPKDVTDYIPTTMLIGGYQAQIPLVIDKETKLSFTDQPVDGILGRNFLSTFLVLFDAARHEITLTSPRGVTADELKQLDMADATVINLTQSAGWKLDLVHVQLSNGFKIAAQDMIVDTGAAGTLISQATAKQLGLTLHKVAKDWQAYNGNVPVSEAVVDRLQIGNLAVKNQNILCNVGTDPYYSMNLGMDILKNYRMLLDYKNMKMYLKPNPWVPPASTDTLSAPPSPPGSVPSLVLPAGK